MAPKKRASKAAVQSTEANKLPVPDLETESAAEMVYGTDENPQSRSAFNKKSE